MMIAKYAGIGVLILAGNMGVAQAAPYSTIGSFANPNFPDDPRSVSYLYNNDATGFAEFGWGVNFDTLESSRFLFDGASGNVDMPTSLPLMFNLGSFSYTNLDTVLVGEMVTVDLDLGVDIFGVGSAAFRYGLEVTNTTNTISDPDNMRVASTPDSLLFTLEGTDYELAMLGFSIDGGNSFATSFDLGEGSTLNMGVYGQLSRVSASAVPVPASVWLFGSALMGLVSVVRRKR